MLIPTQRQFVADCLSKYRWESIPSDQRWEEAHYPMPQCSGEGDTVRLWSADHTVQGLLQSVELDHKCFHHLAIKRDMLNLAKHYPEYLPLYEQLNSHFSKKQGKKGGKKTAELKLGVHAPGMASKGGKIGGLKGGKIGSTTTNAQRWRCLVTGFISSSGPLSHYQKKRGIDTSLRERVYSMVI